MGYRRWILGAYHLLVIAGVMALAVGMFRLIMMHIADDFMWWCIVIAAVLAWQDGMKMGQRLTRWADFKRPR